MRCQPKFENANNFHFLTIIIIVSGKGDPHKGVQRPRGEMSRDGVRGRPRAVPRSDGTVPYRRPIPRH